MAIQDEIYKQIEQEINSLIVADKFNLVGKEKEAKKVAEMLAGLSVDPRDVDNLVNQSIAQIKIICK